jgi:transketolase
VASLEIESAELRLDILEAIYRSGKGHLGGAMSMVDILIALQASGVVTWDQPNGIPNFILSKGHSAVALYGLLCKKNLISKHDLMGLNQGGLLGEHPDYRIPGVPVITGSLGHGLGLAAGIVLAERVQRKTRSEGDAFSPFFVLLGDGECYEGSIWEAAAFASGMSLGCLIAIVDRNRLITHGNTEDLMPLEPFEDKWTSFGWRTICVDGHDLSALEVLFQKVCSTLSENEPPTVIIAETVKGKGISFMENDPKWHHGSLSREQFLDARRQIHESLGSS